MKFQPKRFVVEVKRGTSRASFASPDPAPDRFSSAEAMLFGGTPKAEVEPERATMAKSEAAGGRILRSLVEPPEPVVEEPVPPVRRGRKPGSKNKPKLPPTSAAPAADGPDVIAERPRRGRKPGSKNKPKVPVAAAFPPSIPGGAYDVAAAMRSYGFADDGTLWREPDAPAPPVPSPALPAASAEPAAADDAATAGRRRPRLRDRSTILKRYVLDLEPRPGQPGAMRARRLARAAR